MFVKNEISNPATKKYNPTFFKPNMVLPKLRTNSLNLPTVDKADQVSNQLYSSTNNQSIQRKCHACEDEEGKLQRQATQSQSNLPSGNHPPYSFQKQLIASKGAGSPLPNATHHHMGKALGSDFSTVRVHTDSEAQQMSQEIHAKAFTHGTDIYFNKGQYNPSSTGGKKLLAHELTHVVQQNGASIKKQSESTTIQAMRMGQGNPPRRFNRFNGRQVPQEEQDRVNNAVDQIREVVNDPGQYQSCHNYFRDECPTRGRNSLPQMFNDATLWRADNPGAYAFTWPNYNHIAYTESGYGSGATSLARTLVHELLHNCGISDNRHHQADVAGLYCIGTEDNFSFAAGPAFGGSDVAFLMLSYRRLLANLAGGQIQLRAGLDINIGGIAAEISTLSLGRTDIATGEYGALSIGMLGRSNLGWGGERFGGLTTSLDLGLDVGRFRVRETETEPRSTEISPGFVLQAGLGAEFYLPIGVNAIPLSIGAAYRLVRPLNPQAEAIHGLLGQIGFYF